MIHSSRGRPSRSGGASGALALACALAFGAGSAHATPLFFDGPDGFGFSSAAVSGLPVSATANADSPWIFAGARTLLAGRPGLVVVPRLAAIHSNPQGVGETPSEANPLVADSTWKLTNETGGPLPASYLVFTRIDIDERYEGLRAGLDGALLEIVEYSFDGTDYAFGAIELPSLGVGQSVDVTVRYVVAGLLDYDAETNAFVLPRLGISGLVVPEPAAIGGIGLGLVLLALGRGGSRRSRVSSR